MFAKFARSLIAFGVVFVAYQGYALVAPPLLEPPATNRPQPASTVTDADWEAGSNAVRRYQQLLAHYLPTGHWALTGPIKVLESGPVLFAFEDWKRDDRGNVRLSKCAVLMFRTPRGRAGGDNTAGPVAPRDAVVLEAPGDPTTGFAAELQFGDGFDPTRGKVGKLTGGRFPGPITIRSDGPEPGVEDDLWIETRDLQLAGPLLFTPHDVRVRYGLNRGGGRRLEIKLIEEPAGSPGGGLKIAGVESLEVFEQVRLELHGGGFDGIGFEGGGFDGGGFEGGGDAQPGANPPPRVTSGGRRVKQTAYTTASGDNLSPWIDAAGDQATGPISGPRLAPANQPRLQRTPPLAQPPAVIATPRPSAQPVEVTCGGSLRMDLVRFVASFQRQVVARQLNLSGPSDQLTCERLDLHFTDDNTRRIDPSSDADFARRQQSAAKDLRPRRLVAYGEPVKLDAPARGLTARGRKLQLDLDDRRITLGGAGSYLRHASGEVQAPLVRYQHPAKDSPSPVGRLWLAGPGRLRLARSGGGEPITAAWRQAAAGTFPVELAPGKNGPVLTVVGGPEVAAPGVGKLTAERVEIALAEKPADGPTGPAIEVGNHATALLPERISATGDVRVDSPELLARTDDFTAWVRPQSDPLAPRDARPRSARNPTGGSANRLAATPATSGRRATRPPTGQATGQPQRDRYSLTAKKMELDVVMTAGDAVPHRLDCTGGAQFRELATGAAAAPTATAVNKTKPLVVTGDRIRVDRLHTETIKIDVLGGDQNNPAMNPGSPPAMGPASPPATIAARGVTLTAGDVHLDQATNRLWADGPGQARLETDRDLLGQATTATTDLHLRWRGGLDFDGRLLTLNGDVFGEGPHDWVRAQKMTATLARPIDLSGKSDQRTTGSKAVEVARIDCSGGVTLDHRSIDERGQRSHERAQLQTLAYEHRTGALSGSGPGWVRSVHLSTKNSLALSSPAGVARPGAAGGQTQPPPQPAAGGSGERLRYLRVDFLQGVAGNLNTRAIAFHERVRAIYGPVLAWQHELPLDHPGGLPPDVATLACDHLQVNEDPAYRGAGSRLGPLELVATGSVDLETARRGGGVFTAQSTRASYAQSKELFVIEGRPGAYATIWIQDRPGQPPKVQTARKFSFWRNTNQLKIEDLGGFDSAPGRRPPGAAASRPTRRR